MTRRPLLAAWMALCAVGAAWCLLAACGYALVGRPLYAAWMTVATIGWLTWVRSAHRRWQTRRILDRMVPTLTAMRRTRRCVHPGHMWGPHLAGSPFEPGWCVCGEMFRDQDECDALNWRCQP